MSLTDTFENSLLLLIFNATAIADLAENDTTTPLTNLFISLHTADPGEVGDQTTNEAAYTAYARQGLLRTSADWTVTANSVSPQANVDFPEATAGSETETHMGVGTLTSGAGVRYMNGVVSPNIVVSAGVTPRITTATTITFD